MIKAVIIGFQHMHVNEVALYLNNQPSFELVGAADSNSDIEIIEPMRYTAQWNKMNIKENFCSNIFDDYIEMLDKLKPDVAFILSENSGKKSIVEECAKRKINVIIEKPMAINLKDAKEIQAIINKYGIEAYVNWPVLWRPYLHTFKKVLDSGVVGKPIKLQYINGHTGPLGKGARHRGVSANAEEMTDEQRKKTWWHQKKYGGGVFLDIGCYGSFFTKWLLGQGEKSATAIGKELNTPFGETADNFAAIVRFDDKMAVLEGTWTTPRAVIPSGPMLICTEGVIMCTGGAENQPDVRAYDIFGNEIEIEKAQLGVEFIDMPNMYAWHKESGNDMHKMTQIDTNVEIMAILDAIITSAESNKEEPIHA